jgi:hypothetical protein
MANIIQINGYTISSSNGGGDGPSTPTFPYTGSAIISGSLIITGSTVSTSGFTGSLFGTASWATNALTASRVQLSNGDYLAEQGSRFTIDAARPVISGSIIVSIWGNNGISLDSQTTVTGDLLPGAPYTNNTSSYSLGSSTKAWKDLYVSNGSVYFISGSNTASISFTNGNIDFGGTNLIIPTGSVVASASFAQTSSTLTGLTTVGNNLITQPDPSAIRYMRINADNSISQLTVTQLQTDLGLTPTVLANDVAITAVNTNLNDITGLSFSIIAGNKYKFRAELYVTASPVNIGSKFAVNANVAVSAIVYRVTGAGGVASSNFVHNAFALDSASTTNVGAVLANQYVVIEGILIANNTGTAIMRFGKGSANSGTLTVKAGSFVTYQTL